jgi:hypothetical protein
MKERNMPGGAVHTVHSDGPWINEVEGEGQEGESHSTKEEAKKAGRELAQRSQVEHMVHNEDGQIHERNSYGNDPRDVPG